MRRTAIEGLLILSFLGCLVFMARESSAQPVPAREPFRPVAGLKSLMRGQGERFMNLGELLEDPTVKQRTERMVIEAELLAELANVNTFHREKTDYRNWAKEVSDTALQIAREARKESGKPDEQRIKALYGKLKNTCAACHDVYQ